MSLEARLQRLEKIESEQPPPPPPYITPRDLIETYLDSVAPDGTLPDLPFLARAIDEVETALAEWEANDPDAATALSEPDPAETGRLMILGDWPADLRFSFGWMCKILGRHRAGLPDPDIAASVTTRDWWIEHRAEIDRDGWVEMPDGSRVRTVLLDMRADSSVEDGYVARWKVSFPQNWKPHPAAQVVELQRWHEMRDAGRPVVGHAG
jgi:hypothetical protein